MSAARVLDDAFGWLRAPVPDPSLPEPETRLRRYTIRAIALAGIALRSMPTVPPL